MYYFIIFDKRGVVVYQEGKEPSFINDLIQSINVNQEIGFRNIQDDIMEYQIIGQYILLSISKTKVLSQLTEKFKNILSDLKPNDLIHNDLIEKSIENVNIDEHIFSKENNKKNQQKIIEKSKSKESLNYSESSLNICFIEDDKKTFNFKNTFSLFSSKISTDELSLKMNDFLIRKNVDPLFSRSITDDVVFQLKSSGIGDVTEEEFKDRMAFSLSKIIPIADHKSFIDKIRNQKRTFSICFLGVNGVGKSTSLAKMACWLLQNGLKVYIAACDTFRAGAIEQLKVHVERFNRSGHKVGFYETGYSKDDASVAKSAIIRANSENYDVILIDTAGRMHNKENLMKSLTKLIKVNEPDHILFVGEALVGSDSLAHIKEFNKRISEGCEGRKVDSIILTKVDTVSDKIGQILNLTFSSSAPLLFLGTGQSNKDLTIVDSKKITELLLS